MAEPAAAPPTRGREPSDAPGPGERLLTEVFALAVARHGGRVALEIPPGEGRPDRVRLTYADLNRRADLLAHALRPRVQGECVVALLLPRTHPGLFAAQLAAWRVGAAFTSIDPGAPDAQVRYVLEDSAAVCLISDAAGLARVPAGILRRDSLLDVDALLRGSEPPSDLPARAGPARPAGLAYVIYTSGTTGQAKGVCIEHASIANLVASDVETFGLGPEERVAQGSSPTYDSSLEETWLAFSAGATLVVLDEATLRLGPDLPAWLRAERISVLCPPPTLLRTMGLADPRAALPDLRLLYVGGEALTSDVADRWAPGRWLENGYGPTECTVTVLRARVREREPVTIGRPIRGHRAYVLDEHLEPVAPGEPGELCLAGVGLARGYLGRPELTAERFPAHPTLGRLYRTGDRVRAGPDGAFLYLGRIDAQVKIRGHRIELGAVESALAGLPGVREAACGVQESPAGTVLCAFVVPLDPARPPRWEDLEPRLREGLPEPCIPSRFQVLERLPRLGSGKLDRKSLPAVAASARTEGAPVLAPADEVERYVAQAFADTLGLGSLPSTADDFFLDLGGTSVGAAQVISRLRSDPSTASLTVRDVYEGRSAAALSARARARRVDAMSGAPDAVAPPHCPLWFSLAQGLWLLAGLVVLGAALYAGTFELAPRLLLGLGLGGTLLAAPLLGLLLTLLYAPVAVLATALVKRLVIGRYRPLRVPVWSAAHLRHWMVERVAALVPWRLLEDTVFTGAALRLLGARIGRRVHVHRDVDLHRGGWDLLSVGDDASLGQEVALRLVSLEEGHVVVGPVRIGAGATLETRSGVQAGAEVGAGACLAPLSWLAPGARVPDGERWDGVPAGPAGRAAAPPARTLVSREFPPLVHGLTLVLMRLARLAPLLVALLLAAWLAAGALGIDAPQTLAVLLHPLSRTTELGVLVALLALSVAVSSWAGALGLRLLGRVRAGVMGRYSLAYLRVLAKTEAVVNAGTLWSGTLFWPAWLRWAGMRVGRRCEISTILDVVPECVTVGEETFLADGLYIGNPVVRGDVVEVAATALGRGSFVGNHAVIPAGSRLPPDLLVGVATVADASRMGPGTGWFGHPSFALPRGPAPGIDRRLTHEPSFLRRLTRVTWEAARVLLPVPPLLAAILWLDLVERARSAASPALLLGRVRAGTHPLWSCWCSRWDFFYMAWDAWARRLLGALEGTLLLAWVLRAVGTRVGRRVVLGPGSCQVVDPDMLTLEDDATVHALFQAHSFEDRLLKIDHVRIGPGASVGEGAVVFYGATVGAGARVAPHSVVMKHEHLTPGLRYVGCPTAEQAGAGVP